jgi:hypothetical protein
MAVVKEDYVLLEQRLAYQITSVGILQFNILLLSMAS